MSTTRLPSFLQRTESYRDTTDDGDTGLVVGTPKIHTMPWLLVLVDTHSPHAFIFYQPGHQPHQVCTGTRLVTKAVLPFFGSKVYSI